MTHFPAGFDANHIPPSDGNRGGKSLPVSDKNGHLVVVTGGNDVDTQSGGKMLVLNVTITDGPHRGVEATWGINIENQNADAVKIGFEELSAVCHCVGRPGAKSVQEILNLPFRLIVGASKDAERAKKGYTDVNAIRRADGSKCTDPPGTGAAPAVAAPMPQPGAVAPPPAPTPPAVAPPAVAPPVAPVAAPAAPPAPAAAYPVQPAPVAAPPMPAAPVAAPAPVSPVAPVAPPAPAPAAPGGQAPWKQG